VTIDSRGERSGDRGDWGCRRRRERRRTRKDGRRGGGGDHLKSYFLHYVSLCHRVEVVVSGGGGRDE
jgi:hypothetical protein